MAVLRALEARRYDAILLGGIDWDLLGEEIHRRIRERVEAGTGLLAIAPRGKNDALWQMLPVRPSDEPIAPREQASASRGPPGFPTHLLAPLRIRPYAITGDVHLAVDGQPVWVKRVFGKGRVAALLYDTMPSIVRVYAGCRTGGITPAYIALEVEPAGNPVRVGLWYDLVARALLDVVAGDEPHVIHGLHATPDGHLHALASDEIDRVEAYLGNLDGCEMSGPHPLRRAGQGWHGRVELHAGHSVVWVRALTNSRVRGWWTGSIHLTESSQPDGPATDPIVLTNGESLVLPAALRRVEPDTKLTAELVNAMGETIARFQGPATRGRHEVTLPTGKARSVWHQLRVWCERNGIRTSRARRIPVYVLPDRTRDFVRPQFVAWSNLATTGMRPHLVRQAVAQLRAAGITAALFNAPNNECVAMSASGLRVCVLAGGIGYCAPKRDVKSKLELVRSPCLSDPAWREHWRGRPEMVGRLHRRFAPLDYWYGDEQSITKWTCACDYCFSPHCLAAFGGWLQSRYRDVAALNSEWQTQHASFSSVVPATLDEVRGRTTLAAWADHRAFMEHLFSTVHEEARDALRRGDPEARIATSGTQAAAAYGGWDWTQVPRAFDALHTYTGQGMGHVQRSFGGTTRLPWAAGYGASGGRLKTQVWRAMLRGCKGVSVFIASSLLNGDLTPTKGLRDLGEVLKPFRGPLGELLCRAEPVFDPVAIHYSQASIHAAHAVGLAEAQRDDRHAAIVALNELGIQPQFVSAAQLANGALKRRGGRVLLLPLSLAMSDAEIHAARELVRSGGWVVALGPAATMNEYLRSLDRSAPSDLLGLRCRPSDPVEQQAPVRWSWGGAEGALDIASRLGTVTECKGRTVARFASGEPAVVVSQHGDGGVLTILASPGHGYLDARPYASVPGYADVLDGWESLLERILRKADIEPYAQVLRDGRRVRYFEPCRMRAGQRELLGLVRDWRAAANAAPEVHRAVLALREPMALRDLFNDRSMPTGSVVPLQVEPDSVFLFEILARQP